MTRTIASQRQKNNSKYHQPPNHIAKIIHKHEKKNTLKRNESIIELCNMLIYFVRLKISTRCKLQNNTYTLEGRKETRTPYHNTIAYEWRKHFLRSLQIMNYFRARFCTNKLLLENHHSRWRWIYRELLLLNWRYSNTMCSCFFFFQRVYRIFAKIPLNMQLILSLSLMKFQQICSDFAPKTCHCYSISCDGNTYSWKITWSFLWIIWFHQICASNQAALTLHSLQR